MEWKEHVARLAPIAITMVAYVWVKYKGVLGEHRHILRSSASGLALSALAAAGIAGTFGAMINKYAPVRRRRSGGAADRSTAMMELLKW